MTLLLALGLVGALAGSSACSSRHAPQPCLHVTGEEAKSLVQKEGAILLDISPQREFAQGTLDGAVNVPIDEFDKRLGQLDPRSTLVTFSTDGSGSKRAARLLRDRGFSAYSLGARRDIATTGSGCK